MQLLTYYLQLGVFRGYKFGISTEQEDKGGKFDDLIFAREDDQRNRTLRFVQAKHKQKEGYEITRTDLFAAKENKKSKEIKMDTKTNKKPFEVNKC